MYLLPIQCLFYIDSTIDCKLRKLLQNLKNTHTNTGIMKNKNEKIFSSYLIARSKT